jgi:hypothetical protein
MSLAPIGTDAASFCGCAGAGVWAATDSAAAAANSENILPIFMVSLPRTRPYVPAHRNPTIFAKSAQNRQRRIYASRASRPPRLRGKPKIDCCRQTAIL